MADIRRLEQKIKEWLEWSDSQSKLVKVSVVITMECWNWMILLKSKLQLNTPSLPFASHWKLRNVCRLNARWSWRCCTLCEEASPDRIRDTCTTKYGTSFTPVQTQADCQTFSYPVSYYSANLSLLVVLNSRFCCWRSTKPGDAQVSTITHYTIFWKSVWRASHLLPLMPAK